jgi:sigma-B regulation protein RsbU (phosphoserine phosphatase)
MRRRFLFTLEPLKPATFLRPERDVAGDFYDVFEVEPGKLALLLGDVTDKGVGSALYMALFRSLLRSSVMMDQIIGGQEGVDRVPPEERLKKAVTLTNNYLCRVHDAGMFATLFFGVLDVESGQLCYLNAGHDYPYVLRAGQIIDALKPTGPAAGVIDEVDYRIEGLVLQPGDTLVLYSDGIIDVTNLSGERFDQERWRRLVAGPVDSASQFVQVAVAELDAFTAGAEQYDDMSLLVVRRV